MTQNLTEISRQLDEICSLINCSVSFEPPEPSYPPKPDAGEYLLRSDSVWLLRSAFMVLTMQSGFALQEAGFVSQKNLANIMVKNTVDVAIGGIFYWMFGYGISFGDGNAFMGTERYFHRGCWNNPVSGSKCTEYIFQFSYASTANTILSGPLAERCSLRAYILFSMVNELSYCVPVRWVWSQYAFLADLGFYDIAGMILFGF